MKRQLIILLFLFPILCCKAIDGFDDITFRLYRTVTVDIDEQIVGI